MPGFEDALARARQKAAADELAKQRQDQTNQQLALDAEEAKRLRIDEVRRSSEWMQMQELVNGAILDSIRAYWEKFHKQNGKYIANPDYKKTKGWKSLFTDDRTPRSIRVQPKFEDYVSVAEDPENFSITVRAELIEDASGDDYSSPAVGLMVELIWVPNNQEKNGLEGGVNILFSGFPPHFHSNWDRNSSYFDEPHVFSDINLFFQTIAEAVVSGNRIYYIGYD